jgi:hypothetical protein
MSSCIPYMRPEFITTLHLYAYPGIPIHCDPYRFIRALEAASLLEELYLVGSIFVEHYDGGYGVSVLPLKRLLVRILPGDEDYDGNTTTESPLLEDLTLIRMKVTVVEWFLAPLPPTPKARYPALRSLQICEIVFPIFPYSIARAYPFLTHLTLVNTNILRLLHDCPNPLTDIWPHLETLSISFDGEEGKCVSQLHHHVNSLIDAGAPLRTLRLSRDGDFSGHNLREIEEDWIGGVRVLWPIDLPDPSELCLLNPSTGFDMVDDLS